MKQGDLVKVNQDYGVVSMLLNDRVLVLFGNEFRVFKSEWKIKRLTKIDIESTDEETKINLIFLLKYFIESLIEDKQPF